MQNTRNTERKYLREENTKFIYICILIILTPLSKEVIVIRSEDDTWEKLSNKNIQKCNLVSEGRNVREKELKEYKAIKIWNKLRNKKTPGIYRKGQICKTWRREICCKINGENIIRIFLQQ